ncbi:MAG TPA: hypothetical protein VFV31_11205 [Chitinophagaceae bacterium]|nr:hypothetical protein [Chitinophagaceae bacterium]
MILFIPAFAVCWLLFGAGAQQQHQLQERKEIQLVQELYRLRNEHKADSAEQFFADTVKVYMKYLRNVPKKRVTESDRQFWKTHPKNKFEITGPIKVIDGKGTSTAIFTGKEYLDGINYQNEQIEIVFNRYKKIISFRGFSIKKTN